MKALRYTAMAVAAAVLVGLAGVGNSQEAKKVEWKSLFNGKDLDGWKANNTNAVWTVEDGAIMGTQTAGKGGDLFYATEFDNFELKFTYKVGWPANSGMWYRTDPKNSRGFQFDILKYKRPATFSGALYYPGCKTTFAFTNPNEKLENQADWNEAVIYANGDHIVHWLNGHMIGEAHDKAFTKGAVGIQVHPGKEMIGMKIYVKNVEIRPLAAGDAPTLPITPTSAPASAPATK